MPDWFDLTYLQTGTPRQQAAWQAIQQTRIMTILGGASPVLVGTIPIGIDIENSDLDIICYAKNLNNFAVYVAEQFGAMPEFKATQTSVRGDIAYVAQFIAHGFTFEIFAQSIPVTQQYAYRHMVVEDRILNIGGEKTREDIIRLKKRGYKTEPAFARLLGFVGDPYENLIALENWDDTVIKAILMKKRGTRMGRIVRVVMTLLFLGVVIAGVGVGVWMMWQSGTTDGERQVVNALPTHTPAPDETASDAPVITSSDNCEVVTASGLTVDADTARTTNRFRSLLNFTPKPTAEPDVIEIPESAGRNVAIIQFTPESERSERIAYVRSVRGIPLREIDSIDTYIVVLPNSTDIMSLPTSPIVTSAEPDHLAASLQFELPSNSADTTASAIVSPISDPLYADQWGLNVMGIPAAWTAISPDAPEVVVAVIDSGICAAHPDLEGRLVDGWDFVDFDNDPDDSYGHGCGVSGIIVANNNNARGIAGGAPNAKVMPLRVLDENGLGQYSSIATAIIYAADHGADIVNLSLAGRNESPIVADAIEYAVGQGVTLVAASGNVGDTRVWFPASHPDVIAVGSIDDTLEMSSFTNNGPTLDILAPGRDIMTTNILGDYEVMTGTSFAAPHVAAAAALTLALDTELNTDEGIVFLYPPEEQTLCE